MDDDTYTLIHVDFPVAFVREWLAARSEGPMSFHYVTGMGTDAQGGARWAREKGRAELEVAALAEPTPCEPSLISVPPVKMPLCLTTLASFCCGPGTW